MKKIKNLPALRRTLITRLVVTGIASIIGITGLVYFLTARSTAPPHSITLNDESIARLKSKGQVVAAMDDRGDIMSQFICNCGTCKIIDDLRDCNCSHLGGAKEVKRFIDERIQENKYTAVQIVDMVGAKYGGKKKT